MKPCRTQLGILVILSLIVNITHAQTGFLNSSFGNKGLLTDPVRRTFEKAIVPHANKTMLIGSSGFYQGFSTFMIDRLLPDGSKDASFGTNGSAFILFPQNDFTYAPAYITSLAVLPDGKIVAAGNANSTFGDHNIALARFLPDGKPDSSFNTNGALLTGFENQESVNALVVQPDGKIVIGGTEINPFTQEGSRLFTARLLPDGRIDKSFGNGGKVVSNTFGAVQAIAMQGDGKIVSAGYSVSETGIDFHIERYNVNGSYDNLFDMDGIVDCRMAEGSLNFVNDIAIQNDGKIVAAGKTSGGAAQTFTILRYNPDGNLDKYFGGSGIVTLPFANRIGDAQRVLLTGDKQSKIVVAGSNYSYNEGGDFVLAAYNSDGSLDAGFGNSGIQTTDFGGSDFINSGMLQTDGKILALGNNTGQFPFAVRALACYNGYPQNVRLLVKIKKWLHNHSLSWTGLPATDDIAYYNIEQSSNGKTGFKSIARLNGYSNLYHYNFTNSNLLSGTNYYRIKAVSTGGVIRYSEVLSADDIAPAVIYPNPAKDYLTVTGLPTNAISHLTIADGSGTVLLKGDSKGNTQYRFSVAALKTGRYSVNITTGNKTDVIMFVKE